MRSPSPTSTDDAGRCPRCRTRRPSGADWDELCPACLLTAALAVDDGSCPYDTIAPLAEDTAGITYLAQQLTGARATVALKIYHPRTDLPVVLERYARWKPRLEALTHPRVARLLDVGITPAGRLFKVSEYAPGIPVHALGPQLLGSGSNAATLAQQLVATMVAVHAAHLAHLALDIDRLTVTLHDGPQLALLGVGSRLVVEGADAVPQHDLPALCALLRRLGGVLPDREFERADDIAAALR